MRVRMPHHTGPRRAWGVLLLCVLAGSGSIVACGRSSPGTAGRPVAASSAAGGGLTAARAAILLAAFDLADSAASSAGDLSALSTQETTPALLASTAAVHRAQAQSLTQPAFQHLNPAFAIPVRAPTCFLVTATLKSAGQELTRTDVSQFVQAPDGSWKISHNIQVGQSATTTVRGIGGRPAIDTGQAIDPTRRGALAAEVFARTIGDDSGDAALVAPTALLDQQFAAGWQVYRQQMAGAGMSVNRSLVDSEWSSCAVPVAGGTLTFLTLRAMDTVTPAPGGPGAVTLSPLSPDMAGTGQRKALTGKQITVSRVEVFLLLVPPPGGAGASVLGLDDAPVQVSATGS